MQGFSFNARNVKPDEGASAIPGGQYRLAIVKSNIVPVKDKPQSFYMSFGIKVMDGQYADSQMRDNINLWNESAQAVEIAMGRLSAYCHATGVLDLNIPPNAAPDCYAQPLHNIPFLADVGIDKNGYNVIKKVMPLGQPGQAGPQMTQAPQGAAPGGWGTQPAQPTNQRGVPPQPAPALAPQPAQAPQQFQPVNAPMPGQAPTGAPAGTPQWPGQPQQPAQQPAPAAPTAAPTQGWPPAQQPTQPAQPPQAPAQGGWSPSAQPQAPAGPAPWMPPQ